MLTALQVPLLLALAVASSAAADAIPSPSPAPSPVPAATPPSQRPPSGWSVGLRLGYALPLGDFAQLSSGRTEPLSEEFHGHIPFVLEAGYRFARHFTAGAYLQVGYPFLVTTGQGLAATECHLTGVASCSGNVAVRAGVQLLFAFAPDAVFQPWVGVGAGYERAVYVLEDGRGGSASVNYGGWELFNVQLGGDLQATPGLAWGPFVALSLAQYSDVEVASGDTSIGTVTIGHQKLHEWLQFGLRLRFGS